MNERHVNNNNGINNSIVLSTINSIVRRINKERLEDNSNQKFEYTTNLEGKIKDDYEELLRRFNNNEINEEGFEKQLDTKFPTNVVLKLKKCSVIMVKMIRLSVGLTEQWVL